MKILIWIGCIFAASLINALFMAGGVTLGAIPAMLIYGFTVWGARALCKMLDENHPKK